MERVTTANTDMSPAPQAPVWHRLLVLAMALAMALLLLAMLLLALPLQSAWLPWMDEVQFVDPGASLFFGQGFTSMVWPYQVASEFFIGNAPGYSLLLAPWFQLWGFGLTQARSLTWALAAMSLLVLWSLLSHLQPRMPAWLKGLALASGFLAQGVMISWWSARYDMLGLLVCACVGWLLVQPASRVRSALLMLSGGLLFFAGFHLVVAAVVVFGLLSLRHPGYRRPALLLGAGVAVAMAGWLVLLASQGLVRKFFIITFGSQHTVSGQLAQLVLQGDTGFFKKFELLRNLPTLDLELTAVALFLLVVLVLARVGRLPRPTALPQLPMLGLLFALVLPLTLLLAGKFPVYYVWLSLFPVLLAAAVLCWHWREQGRHWPLAALAVVLVAVSTLSVSTFIRALHAADGLAYVAMAKWVRSQLRPEDQVYAGFEAYFAARAVSQRVAAPSYGQTAVVPGIPERAGITAILVRRDMVDAATALIQGDWRKVAEFKDATVAEVPQKLDYLLLRRAAP